MEDVESSSVLSKILIAIFVVALADLVFINWWLLKKSTSEAVVPNQSADVVKSQKNDAGYSPSPVPSSTPVEKVVEKNISLGYEQKAISSPNPSPSVQTIVQTANKEIFIPMGFGETKSGNFADLSGVEISIDSSKYSNIDYVVFEASIWVEGGNGRAWAQIINVNDNNAIIESQITNPTSTPTLKSSGRIPLADGNKTYRVQAKTDLTDFAAHIENAHIKIVLK
jgi:hypothetical protein